MCNLTASAEQRFALQWRAVAALERAVLSQRDRVDQLCLIFERRGLQTEKEKTKAMTGLAVAIIEALDMAVDQEAVLWFVSLQSIREIVSLVAAAVIAVDVRLGTEGRACIWRDAIAGRRSAGTALATAENA